LRSRLVAAMAIPAALAGLLAFVLLKPHGAGELRATDVKPPRLLSREADIPLPAPGPALHPIVIRGGRAVLGSDAAVVPTGGVRPAPPVRVTVRSVGLAAPVVPVQRAGDGIGVPPAGEAGWYDGGPRPGEPGRSVLIGHVDDIAGHLAAFGRIAAVRDGAEIKIADAHGRVRAFQVVGRAEVRKTGFPAADVYGPSAHPVLVLITCGGPWLGRARGYRDNILVYARAE
jgi:hypothetical protein